MNILIQYPFPAGLSGRGVFCMCNAVTSRKESLVILVWILGRTDIGFHQLLRVNACFKLLRWMFLKQ
ncbi:Delta-actitoxin-Bgr2b [Frankliniella fusca]|uniref:Delta-actitoxin-Bgr2b n=1 Tax=Frankliniella fusca TaxID=407009 RepID=A0AAE1LIC8_9NEOP|nr:Delta-actitoxin-Bgr2b [Frankliniella fusca]